MEKNPHISGDALLKPMLFKGELYYMFIPFLFSNIILTVTERMAKKKIGGVGNGSLQRRWHGSWGMYHHVDKEKNHHEENSSETLKLKEGVGLGKGKYLPKNFFKI